MKSILLLAGCILICYAAAAIGTVFTAQSIPTWYAAQVKPPLNPPNWIFGPVWSILYTMMGIAIFLVIKDGITPGVVKAAVWMFAAQLAFNTLWSVVFFGAKNALFAIPIIALMWGCILGCIILFWGISRPASVMMMPYLLWVSFASYLNVGIYWLNK